ATGPMGAFVSSEGFWETTPSASLAGQEPSDQSAPSPTHDAEKSNDKATKPPAPRTLSQAVHAYVKRLCSGQCLCENPPNDVAGSGKAGNGNEQPSHATSGNQEKKGENSPAATKDQEESKDQKNDEGQKKESDEIKKEGKEEKDKEPEPSWF